MESPGCLQPPPDARCVQIHLQSSSLRLSIFWTAAALHFNSSATARRPQASRLRSPGANQRGPLRPTGLCGHMLSMLRGGISHSNRSPCPVCAQERGPVRPAGGASAGHLITGGPGGAARGAGHAPAQSARRPREQARPRRSASADRWARGRRPRRRPRLSPAGVRHERQGLASRVGRIPAAVAATRRRSRRVGQELWGRDGPSAPAGRAWAAE